jgi:hypothetical protein
MRPEFGPYSLLGPVARHRCKQAGMVASLAVVLAAGVISPAAAAARSVTDYARAEATPSGGDKCKPSHHKPRAGEAVTNDQCKGPTGPRGATGPKGTTGATGATGATGPCSDIDAYQVADDFELRVALSGGRTYAGIRDLRATEPHDFLWTDLSLHAGYPAGQDDANGRTVGFACGASINTHSENDSDPIKIDVITTVGGVWETTCAANVNTHPATLDCGIVPPNPWVLVNRQPAANQTNGGTVVVP